jgi:hypothetical protein
LPVPAFHTRSLRSWALLTVAIVAVVGLIYGADSGARRAIHHAQAGRALPQQSTSPPAIPHPPQ